MKKSKKLLSIFCVLCLALTLAVPALAAAYGRVGGESEFSDNNGLYWGSDGKLHNIARSACYSLTEELSSDAGHIENIYAHASIVTYKNGEILEDSFGLGHYVTEVDTKTAYVERTDEETGVEVQNLGLHRTRYTNNTTDEVSSGGLVGYIGYDKGPGARTTNARFGSSPEAYQETLSAISTEFSVDLSDFNYVAFGDLWCEDIDENLSPLKSIVTDIFATSTKGDHLPQGVFYLDTLAYTLRETADGTQRLTQYDIAPITSRAVEDYDITGNFHSDYVVLQETAK